MKEELYSLKENATQVMEAKENFKKQRAFFNMKVEEKRAELNLEGKREIPCDYYDDAKVLNLVFPEAHETVTAIKEQHPKYGNRRIKELAIKELQGQSLKLVPVDMDAFFDDYFLYESCGFFKLLEQEEAIEVLEGETIDSTRAVFEEVQGAAIKVGTSITNVVKPYGEVAKLQFEEASKAAKHAVNKGSKKLMRILTDIQKRTEE